MTDLDITLYFNKLRLQAVEQVLADEGCTLEDKLKEHFNFLYEQLVPAEQRLSIEAEIEQNEAAERAAKEARRRFGVFRIRQDGEDYHFTSDHFCTPMQAAYRYRLYDRGELSAKPETLAAAFIETSSIDFKKFNEACVDINSDNRVTALIEFDLDEGNVSFCDSSDNTWRTYCLRDLSTAAYKAYRSKYRAGIDREKIFDGALAGKEIKSAKETENSNGRLGVIRVRENGEDKFFISHQTPSFFAAAHLYWQYAQGELNDSPKTFAEAFLESTKISEEAFEAHSDHIPYDAHVKFAAEFYLDSGVVSICDSSDNCQWFYDLKDVSAAVSYAYRQSGISMSERCEIFEDSLGGKDLSPDEWAERRDSMEATDDDETLSMRL